MSFTLLRYKSGEYQLATGHYMGYTLSTKEVCLSVATGLTAIPIALRHFELAFNEFCDPSSKECRGRSYVWKHLVIALIQCLPVVGAVAALVEAAVARHYFRKAWDLQFFDQKELDQQIYKYLSKDSPDDLKPKRVIASKPLNEPRAIATARKFIAVCRGKLERKKRQKLFEQHFLPKQLRTQVKQFLSDPYATAPRASAGVTAVFLPKEIPSIVLKVCKEQSYRRMWQMAQVRVRNNIFGDCPLVIPKVLLHRKLGSDALLIEQRLPINPWVREQIKLYLNHGQEFTSAIRAFARLVLRFGLKDMIGYPAAGSCVEPRYDNFPLFIDEQGAFKIGLIDLELIEKKEGRYLERLAPLVYMFPNHMDEIIDEARQLGVQQSELDKYKDEVIEKQVKGKQFIQNYYTDLLTYLASKKDKTKEPLAISTPLIREIVNEIVAEHHIDQKDVVSALETCFKEVAAFVK